MAAMIKVSEVTVKTTKETEHVKFKKEDWLQFQAEWFGNVLIPSVPFWVLGRLRFQKGPLAIVAHSENKPWLKAFGLVAYASVTGIISLSIFGIWINSHSPITSRFCVSNFKGLKFRWSNEWMIDWMNIISHGIHTVEHWFTLNLW